MTSTTIPTNQDLMEAISGLKTDMREMETRLIGQITAAKNDLKNEIAGAYGLHDDRIGRLESAVGE